MKPSIFSILIVFLFVFSANAQTPNAAKTTDEPVLRVEIDGKTINLKSSDLAKLPRREVKIKNQDGKEIVFEGVDVREILKSAGIKFDKETERLNLTRFLIAEAADDYRSVFAFAELDPDFTDKTILLAEKSDGKPLSEKYGRWQIVVPDEKKRGRWVRQVVALKVKTAQ
ncbi:MAG TPA: hypothetical protein VGC76_16910 [Pyrinomonadaceae bacterium]|jgi:hypothetical protein